MIHRASVNERSWIWPTFFGIVFGILGATITNRLRGNDPSVREMARSTSASPVTSVPPQRLQPQPDFSALVRRLAEIEHRVAQQSSRPAPNNTPINVQALRAAREEEAVLVREDMAREVQEHSQELVDPVWAQNMSAAITEDLQHVASRYGFRVSGTECRSSTCLTTLEWPTTQAAHAQFVPFMMSYVDRRCGRRGELTPTEGTPTGPSQAQIVFHCEGAHP